MLEEDLDDTHLCIKCSRTIVGLENYIEHRKSNCSTKPPEPPTRDDPEHSEHRYRNYDFSESGNFHKPEEVDKANKSLNDSYEIPYELGADLFFSSLELQSSSRKTITNSTPVASTSGKQGSTSKILTRKATAALLSHQEPNDNGWISPSNNTDSLMKAVRDISGNKKCDNLYMVPFQHDSPEPTDDEDDDDDEDYEEGAPPSTHTGGKWKPGNTISPLRSLPAWDDRSHWDAADPDDDKNAKHQDNDDDDHDFIPPPGHTKGKWVPGTKIIKLDYKEEVEVEKIFSDQYWCNTCNRKLATKLLYERHIKSNLHLKRSLPEQELERAKHSLPKFSERVKKRSLYLNENLYITPNFSSDETKPVSPTVKRRRRKYFMKCDTCKMRFRKEMLGKHLISHYHYRRISRNPFKCFELVLKHIDKIVYQAPYQCQPCRFYTNTFDDFMDHWNSEDHADVVESPGRFSCNFCKFECEDNNQMRRHLLGQEHNEVILAVNRSFPIVIGKRVVIECPQCKQVFRYNIELRKHAAECTREPAGTASNDYQSKFICDVCQVSCKSKLALHMHKRRQHKQRKFYCSICKIEFSTADDAKKHRSTPSHRVTVATLNNSKKLTRKCVHCGEVQENILELKEHIARIHPEAKRVCPYCGDKFTLPQEISQHIRAKVCRASTSSRVREECENIDDPEIAEAVKHMVSSFDPGDPAEKLADGDDIGANVWSCTKCDFRSDLKAELLYHEILHKHPDIDGQTPLQCSLCEKSFRKYSLRFHLRQHTDERTFRCSHCPMRFSRNYNLKTHIENVHSWIVQDKKTVEPDHGEDDEKTLVYQCDFCGKCFNSSKYLQQHVKVHKQHEKKFKCSVEGCIYTARNQAILKVHMSSHATEKIFPCSFDSCNYKGKSAMLLKRHMKGHEPVNKNYACPHCDFKSAISTKLKRHIRIHTGEKPYKCPYCNFCCNTSENLRKHVLNTSIHDGRCLYECQYCSPENIFKTNFQKEYRTHLILTHQAYA